MSFNATQDDLPTATAERPESTQGEAPAQKSSCIAGVGAEGVGTITRHSDNDASSWFGVPLGAEPPSVAPLQQQQQYLPFQQPQQHQQLQFLLQQQQQQTGLLGLGGTGFGVPPQVDAESSLKDQANDPGTACSAGIELAVADEAGIEPTPIRMATPGSSNTMGVPAEPPIPQPRALQEQQQSEAGRKAAGFAASCMGLPQAHTSWTAFGEKQSLQSAALDFSLSRGIAAGAMPPMIHPSLAPPQFPTQSYEQLSGAQMPQQQSLQSEQQRQEMFLMQQMRLMQAQNQPPVIMGGAVNPAAAAASNNSGVPSAATALPYCAQQYHLLQPAGSPPPVASLEPLESEAEKVKGKTRQKAGRKKKEKDQPKRPLSAYNIFFRQERARLVAEIQQQQAESSSASSAPMDDDDTEGCRGHVQEEGGAARRKATKRKRHGMGFEKMAKVIGALWKDISPERLALCERLAREDLERYRSEMKAYGERQRRDQEESSGHRRQHE